MNARRVLLLDTGKEWGGGTNSMFELLKRIDRERFAVTALFYYNYAQSEGKDVGAALESIGVPFKVLPRARQPSWAKLAKELVRGLLVWNERWRKDAVVAIELAWRIRPNARQLATVLQKGTFDLLYLNNQPASNLEGYLAGEATHVPVIQHCRIEASMTRREARIVNRVARRIVCVSQGVAESLLRAGVHSRLLTVVFNGIDCNQPLPGDEQMRRRLGFSSDTVVFGTVGSLIKRKAIEHQLLALSRLPEPGWAFLILGDGPEREDLQSLAESLGIAERVVFAGFQDQPLAYIAAMDVFILSSSHEGLPRVILEAMMLGKPAIASNVTGSRELVRDGETGFLYPYGDTKALANLLLQLLVSRRTRRHLGELGRQVVRNRFTIERYVSGVENVFVESLP